MSYGNKSLKHPVTGKTIFDIKANGGVVVSAGSIHPDTGRPYRIVNDIDPAESPKWILDYLNGKAINTDPLLEIPLSKSAGAKFISSLRISSKKKKQILAKPVKGKRSEIQFKVIKALIKEGYDEKTIRFILDHYPVGEKCREKGNEWRDKEIERARSKSGEFSVGVELDVEDFVKHLKTNIIGSTGFLKMKIPKPKMYMEPWLAEKTIHMIYGPRGIGKSTLAQILAVTLTTWKANGVSLPSIGPWVIKQRGPVLLVDGEANDFDLQKRIKDLRKPIGKESKNCPLGIYTASHAAKNSAMQLNISKAEWREAFFHYLKHEAPWYRILVIDNLVTLTPGIDENSKREWDPINQWLIRLKHFGITTILLHHSGRQKHQRGTTSREDTLDCIINLSVPDDYDVNDGAYFTIKYEKTRNIPPSSDLSPFTLKLVPHAIGNGALTWETGKPKGAVRIMK